MQCLYSRNMKLAKNALNQKMIQYVAYKKLVYSTIMLPQITNYFHVLKARIVVAYALFYASSIGRGICRLLMKNTLFLIRHPFACFRNGFPKEIKFKRVYADVKKTYSFFIGISSNNMLHIVKLL